MHPIQATGLLARALLMTALFVHPWTLTGEAGGSGPSPASVHPASRPPIAPARTVRAPKLFSNPVLDQDFPDPFVLARGGSYYAYATNSAGNDIQLATSHDLVHWRYLGNALGNIPGWADGGLTWAPEVLRRGARYLMYYTVHDRTSQRQCISVAVAHQPEGPFEDLTTAPLVCQTAQGGSIDPSPFVDGDGKLYLLWKNDGNCCNLTTHIYLGALSPDGLHLTGKPRVLISNDAPWEGNLIEAPTLHRERGVYYLLFSAGAWDSGGYGIGVATSHGLTDPFVKSTRNPIVKSSGSVAGPGHQSVVQDAAGNSWLVYHGWKTGEVGNAVGHRSMRIDPVFFKNAQMVFGTPSTSPQPAPKVNP